VLAAVMHLALRGGMVSPDLRLVVGTGFCGGFTTYSTFNYETMKSLQEGAWALAAANVAVTLVVCMLAGFAGWAAAGWLARA